MEESEDGGGPEKDGETQVDQGAVPYREYGTGKGVYSFILKLNKFTALNKSLCFLE